MSQIPPTAASAPSKPPQLVITDDDVITEAERVEPESGVGRAWRRFCSAAEWLVGMICIVIGLAILAAIPVLQLLSFGYLLEVSGRIARERRVASGFIGYRKAARVGFLVAHTWVMFLPLRLLSDYWHDAQLIDPGGAAANTLRIAQFILMILTVGHVVFAWYCGGRARHFYWPVLAPWYLIRSLMGKIAWSEWFPLAKLVKDVKQKDVYVAARDSVWDFVVSLRLPYYLRLGAIGLVGAAVWLAIPVLLLAGAAALPPGAATLSGLLGGVLLAVVAVRLPFMETNYAATGEWEYLMNRRIVRHQFGHAPIAFWLALLLTLGLAIPLHLVQAAPPIIPDLRWTLNLLFALLLLPARFATGWAVARANRRDEPRIFVSRWTARLAAIPVALFYALVIYFSQFINFYGSWRLLEQPAFMLPAPFWLL